MPVAEPLGRHATAVSYLPAAGHLVIAGLDQAHRSAFQWPPIDDDWQWLAIAGDWDGWTIAHTLVAVAIIVTVSAHLRPQVALRVSVGVMLSWGLLAALWGIAAPQPVSLVGPCLALAVCVPASYISASFWTRRRPKAPNQRAS